MQFELLKVNSYIMIVLEAESRFREPFWIKRQDIDGKIRIRRTIIRITLIRLPDEERVHED